MKSAYMMLNTTDINISFFMSKADMGRPFKSFTTRIVNAKNDYTMQVFVPFQLPIDVAKCLDKKRLTKQILEADQILAAISGESQSWLNHPIVKMYKPYFYWLRCYRNCLKGYADGDVDGARWWNGHAALHKPPFLTNDFCDQHKRRLYTKAPSLYPQFASYGKTDENWYYVDGELVKYVNGKKV
jgi:hypothetical protein